MGVQRGVCEGKPKQHQHLGRGIGTAALGVAPPAQNAAMEHWAGALDKRPGNLIVELRK